MATVSPKEAAKSYRDRGWVVFPLPQGMKRPFYDKECTKPINWNKVLVPEFKEDSSDEAIEKRWANDENVAVVLGDKLIDIDLDCDEAIRIAPDFLPPTPFKFTRKGLPGIAHWVYETSSASKYKGYEWLERTKDDQKGHILEFRTGNIYTMFPPSIHPNGDALRFAPKSAWPEVVEPESLLYRCDLLAASVLLATYWPSARNEASMYLAGGLARAELNDDDNKILPSWSDKVMAAVLQLGGNKDYDNDFRKLADARRRISADKNVKGFTSLAKLIGDAGQKVVKRFRQLLRIMPKKPSRVSSALLSAPFADQLQITVSSQGNRVVNETSSNVEVIVRNDTSLFADPAIEENDEVEEESPNIYYDEFSLEIFFRKVPAWEYESSSQQVVPRPVTDDDFIHLRVWLERKWNFRPAKGDVYDGVVACAQRFREHGVKSYIKSLEWDSTSRLDTIASRYFNQEDTEYSKEIWRMWCISAIARIFTPGLKVDYMIILEGAQSIGKSTFFRTIAKRDDWFLDEHIDMKSKDGAELLRGIWIVELQELDSLRRSETSTQKSFLTRQKDRYRPPYGRVAKMFPRTCVFSGSVNPTSEGYLKDVTGNRRYWPFACGRVINLDQLKEEVDQIWAEAYHAYRQGEVWYPQNEDTVRRLMREQDMRRERPFYEDLVLGYLTELLQQRGPDDSDKPVYFTLGNILYNAMGHKFNDNTLKYLKNQVTDYILNDLKLKRDKRVMSTFSYVNYVGDQKEKKIKEYRYAVTEADMYRITDEHIDYQEALNVADGVEPEGYKFEDDNDDVPF